MLRTLLGMLAGLIAMTAVVMSIEAFGHWLYPPPPGLDPRNPDDLARIMAAAPVGAMVALVAAWAAGAFVGGGVAARIARRPRLAATVIGLAVSAGVAMMVATIPQHPGWVAALGLLLPLPLALLAAGLFARRTQPAG